MRAPSTSSDQAATERRRSSLAKSAASLQSKLGGLKLHRSRTEKSTGDSEAAGVSEQDPSPPRRCVPSSHPLETFSTCSAKCWQESNLPYGKLNAFEPRSVGDLLVSLPTELLSQILVLLDPSSLFAFRAASATFARLVSLHQKEVARRYFASDLPRTCVSLYSKEPRNLYSLYRVHHGYTTAEHLARSLADFVETEFLRISSRRGRDDFAQSRDRLIPRMVPHLLVLDHFFTSWRRWMLKSYPKDVDGGWPSYNSTMAYSLLARLLDAETHRETVRQAPRKNDSVDCEPEVYADHIMLTKYTSRQRFGAYQMLKFLVQVLRRNLRPPTYATHVEKALRGWNTKNHQIEYVDALVAIGGLDEMRRVLAISSLSERWSEVDRWVESLQKADSMKWQENWNQMVHGPCAKLDPAEADISFDPPMYFTPYGYREVWDMPFTRILSETDGLTWRPKTDREFLSEMLGQDILAGTRWQMNFEFDENGDGEDEETAT